MPLPSGTIILDPAHAAAANVDEAWVFQTNTPTGLKKGKTCSLKNSSSQGGITLITTAQGPGAQFTAGNNYQTNYDAPQVDFCVLAIVRRDIDVGTSNPSAVHVVWTTDPTYNYAPGAQVDMGNNYDSGNVSNGHTLTIDTLSPSFMYQDGTLQTSPSVTNAALTTGQIYVLLNGFTFGTTSGSAHHNQLAIGCTYDQYFSSNMTLLALVVLTGLAQGDAKTTSIASNPYALFKSSGGVTSASPKSLLFGCAG